MRNETVKELFEILGINEVNEDMELNGLEIDYYKFSRILEAIRKCDEYSEIRGHVASSGLFNVSYSTNYLQYERLDSTVWIDGNTVTYDKKQVEKYKIFISNCNWIDLHLNYSENTYATIVIVPK